jgi:hypothetical protein
MFNTFSYKGNANQNYFDISFHHRQITIIKKANNNKQWRQCRGKITLVHCWWEYKLAHLPWKSV